MLSGSEITFNFPYRNYLKTNNKSNCCNTHENKFKSNIIKTARIFTKIIKKYYIYTRKMLKIKKRIKF